MKKRRNAYEECHESEVGEGTKKGGEVSIWGCIGVYSEVVSDKSKRMGWRRMSRYG